MNVLRSVYLKSILKLKVLKNKAGKYDEEKFKTTLIKKLKDRTLDKVAIAHELCQQICSLDTLAIPEDDSIYYLVEAIKHVSKV